MANITPIITALASTSIEGAITGVVRAFDTTPSGVDLPLPCFINLPFEGTIGGLEEGSEEFAGTRMTVHRVKVQLLCSLQADLQDSETQARPFLNRFVTTLDRFKTLNNTAGIIDATVKSYRYGHIQLRQGDPGYLGWEFMVQVREIEENVTYGTTGPAI